MVVENNGIIIQAQKAEKETTNSTVASEKQMNVLVDEVNNYITENDKTEDTGITIPINHLRTGDYIRYNSGTNGEILCRYCIQQIQYMDCR